MSVRNFSKPNREEPEHIIYKFTDTSTSFFDDRVSSDSGRVSDEIVQLPNVLSETRSIPKVSYSAFPPLSRPSSKSNQSLSTPQKAVVRNPDGMSLESPGSAASNLQAASPSSLNLQHSATSHSPASQVPPIPAWAKVYYARPQLPQESRPSASTETISMDILWPGNRREAESGQLISPHLWHDHSHWRPTLFIVPSVDGRSEGVLNKRNIQIVLFAIGYVFPPAWFIASFLPLPPKSAVNSVKGKNVAPRTQVDEDLEKQLNEARHENARWWRKINRILSAFGIFIIGTIIALAVVAAK